MKLLYCTTCGDVRLIRMAHTECLCGTVKAKYVNLINVEWNGEGFLLGFSNPEFRKVVKENNNGEFKAFVLPRKCGSVKIVGE